jgi:hypothetical protein
MAMLMGTMYSACIDILTYLPITIPLAAAIWALFFFFPQYVRLQLQQICFLVTTLLLGLAWAAAMLWYTEPTTHILWPVALPIGCIGGILAGILTLRLWKTTAEAGEVGMVRRKPSWFVVTVILVSELVLLLPIQIQIRFDYVNAALWGGWLIFLVWFLMRVIRLRRMDTQTRPDDPCPFASLSLQSSIGALVLATAMLLLWPMCVYGDWFSKRRMVAEATVATYVIIISVGNSICCAGASALAAVGRRVLRKAQRKWFLRVCGSFLIAGIALAIGVATLTFVWSLGGLPP